MGMTKRPQIGYVGTTGYEMTNDEIEFWYSDACEPWGYVAPFVAAFVMRATGVRHIYLINVKHVGENWPYTC